MNGGVIAAGSLATAEAGGEILKAGGNATDAAVGAALAAFHVEPLLASAAGGGVMMAGDPENGFHVLDFVPTVPGLGTPRVDPGDFHRVSINFGVTTQDFHVGRGAAAVPTGLAGLYDGHRRWGKLPFAEVVGPAVHRCRRGIVLNDTNANFIQILKPIWNLSDESAGLYTVDGRDATVGDTITNTDYASVLELLAAEGLRPFYEGEIARRTVDFFGPASGGLMNAEDLASYRPTLREPLETTLRGGTLLTPPPPSTGGSLIAFSLAVLDRLGLDRRDYRTERHVRAIVDTFLLTMVLRRNLYDGEGFTEEDVRSLLRGDDTFERYLGLFGRINPRGAPARSMPGNTTHISVMDDVGGAASITVSNGEGCGYLIPGTGMHMNNFLGEDDVNPRGFHVDPPGTILASMMSPTIYLREGKPDLVLGSGGSNRLRSAVTQVVFNRLILGRSIEESVMTPRIHLEPDHFLVELGEDDPASYDYAAERFYEKDLFPGLSLYFGGVHAVGRSLERELVGVGDPRRDGAATRVEAV